MHTFDKPIQSSELGTLPKEYPSAAFLSSSVLFVADGSGGIHIFHISDSGVFTLTASHQLPRGPSKLHSVHSVSETGALAIFSSRLVKSPNALPGKSVEFDVYAVKFVLSPEEDMSELWSRRGNHVPFYTSYDSARQIYHLFGGCQYQNMEVPPPSAPYEPSADEFAPIPRAGESLDTKPPPYSWTQTDESVTVAFALPSTTTKSDIHITIEPSSLDLSISGVENTNVTLPLYSDKRLWDGVRSLTSYWTWDKEGGHTFGLLTLYFDKVNAGSKWMHVFASPGSGEEAEVPETLDPSELAQIRESMEKFTEAIRSGDDASGLGLGRGVPSLAENEMDEEADANVGRTAFLTTVGPGDATPYPPVQVLSTPVPGLRPEATSVIVKNDIDGIVFDLQQSSLEWKHTTTYNALAFVLASKQETRFTHHIPGKAVYAFESGAQNRGGNVYIYRSDSHKALWAKQAILKVGNGSGGPLLGVGAIQDEKIVCLLERELVVINALP